MRNLVQLPASVIDMKPKADKSWKLSFETRELTGPEVSLLAENLQGEGWLVYSPNEITTRDVPMENAEPGAKSQSQRLRNVLLVYYKQLGNPGGDFEMFYRVQMEKLIDFVKSKLKDEEDA